MIRRTATRLIVVNSDNIVEQRANSTFRTRAPMKSAILTIQQSQQMLTKSEILMKIIEIILLDLFSVTFTVPSRRRWPASNSRYRATQQNLDSYVRCSTLLNDAARDERRTIQHDSFFGNHHYHPSLRRPATSAIVAEMCSSQRSRVRLTYCMKRAFRSSIRSRSRSTTFCCTPAVLICFDSSIQNVTN
jgi:hypothetical protein